MTGCWLCKQYGQVHDRLRGSQALILIVTKHSKNLRNTAKTLTGFFAGFIIKQKEISDALQRDTKNSRKEKLQKMGNSYRL